MKKMAWLLVAITFFGGSPVMAQKIRVEKIKGNKAVVDFTGSNLVTGRVYELNSSGSSSRSAAGNRDRLIGFSATLSSLTTSVGSASSSSTLMSVGGRYGWNKLSTEMGVLAEIASTSPATGNSSSSFGAGGFFDYNFVPNVPGTEMVYGVGVDGIIGNMNNSVKSYMFWELFPSGYLKWFLLKTTTCFRADLGFTYRSEAAGPDVKISGLSAVVGLAHYY